MSRSASFGDRCRDREMFKFWCAVIFVHFCCASRSERLHIGACRLLFSETCFTDLVQVHLFSGERPDEPIRLAVENLTLPAFVSLNRTNKLLVHGYGGSLDFFATKAIRKGGRGSLSLFYRSTYRVSLQPTSDRAT